MNNESREDNDMPTEVDISNGVRGLHHIPAGARVSCLLRGSPAYDSPAELPVDSRLGAALQETGKKALNSQ
jgi:hypothetical protein